MSIPNRNVIPIDTSSLGSFKGIKIKRGDPARLELYLGDKARRALQDGTSKLAIGMRPELERGRVSIGAFTGEISVSLMAGRSDVEIGDCGHLNLEMTLYEESAMVVGDRTTCNSANLILSSSRISIGNDCMFSHDIVLQSCDQHGIIDLCSMEIVNTKRNISVEDHVWLGRGSFLCPGTVVQKGSIVAGMSVVTKNVAPFSLVAGAPAVMVRSNVSWSRSLLDIDQRTASFLRKNAPRFLSNN